MAGAVTNGVFGHYGAPSRGELVLWGVAISILALIVVRAAMIGVWVGPARTRVRGWLLSVRFENDQFRRVSSVGYSGSLNEGNLDGSARFLKALVFHVHTIRGPRQYYFAGLIAFKRGSERQVSEIERRIAEPSGHPQGRDSQTVG